MPPKRKRAEKEAEETSAKPTTTADNPTNTSLPPSLSYPSPPADSLRIVTWNITSLASCIKKEAHRYILAENAHFYCLQETKLNKSYKWKQDEGWVGDVFGKDDANGSIGKKIEFPKDGSNAEDFCPQKTPKRLYDKFGKKSV